MSPLRMRSNTRRYALVTAAYNEEKHIENLIRSVVLQTTPPHMWVIVSDGSTDETDNIVRNYSSKYGFIHLHRITEGHPRTFVAQVHAINAGLRSLDFTSVDYIGNMDADITVAATYFSDLLNKFDDDSHLGLAGGSIWEKKDNTFQYRAMNSPLSVAHAVQLFRKDCLNDIGGRYMPMPYGGPDWHAEVSARLHGWKVRSFSDLRAYHHRPTGAAAGLLRTCFREGLMDYSLGSHPYFELFRVLRRFTQRPYVIGATIRLAAFVWASATNAVRPVPDEFVRFIREEEMNRLRLLLSGRKIANTLDGV